MDKLIRAALLIALLLVLDAFGQNYPIKPLRLVLPYPPGGGTELIARPLAQKVSESLGQQIIVDTRGGANGNIGMELAAKAPPDGYTIVLALTAQLAINPSFYSKLPYDPVRDYAPITLLGTAPYLLVAHPSVPAKSLPELIALARSKPGRLTFASSGNGGIPHLAFEMLKSTAGIDLIHVPYKGGGPALIDLIGGQVQLLINTISPLLPYIHSGKLRAIAVTSAKRSRTMHGLPAIAETLPGYEVSTMYGVLAPARTPKAIVNTLNAAFVNALRVSEIRERLAAYDFEPMGSTPEQLGDRMRSEIAKWAKVVKDTGARPD